MRPDARLQNTYPLQERQECERFSISRRLATFVVDARESDERVDRAQWEGEMGRQGVG